MTRAEQATPTITNEVNNMDNIESQTLRQTVARLALHASNRRVDAEQSVAELIDQLEHCQTAIDPDHTGWHLGLLAVLYKQYMPKLGRVAKTPWPWVAQAASTKDLRRRLNYVYVTEQWVYGTDGHRGHCLPNWHDLAPGFYNSVGDQVSEGERSPQGDSFPDIARLFNVPFSHDLVLPVKGEEILRENEEGTQVALHNDAGEHDCWVNYKYLQQALGMGEPSRFYRAENQIRLAWDDGRTAIIMPVRD